MKPTRQVTPSGTADPILCGEFREADNYQVWRPRGSGNYLLISTLAGAGRIAAGDRTIHLRPGEALLYSPGAMQDYAAALGPWHLRWVHFVPRPHWVPWLRWTEIAPQVGLLKLPRPAWEAFHQALERMVVARQLGGEHADDLAMNSLEAALLWAHRVVSEDPTAHIDPRVQKALRHLSSRPAEPLQVSRLAAVAGLSPSRFAHLFKAQLGTSPRHYSERLRLSLAVQLLGQTTLAVGEIAAQVGFSDPLYFSRRFRREFRHSPSEWRRLKSAVRRGPPAKAEKGTASNNGS